jgi:HAD superfamily hydrolase (TIGR01509 family)
VNPGGRHGLIFDIDGVMVDSEPVNARASIRVLAEECGLAGVCREDFAAGLGRGAEAYLQAAAAVHGTVLDPPTLARAVAARERGIIARLTAEGLPARPGVLALLRSALADPAFGVAIASSAARDLAIAMLDAAGVPWREVVLVAGDQVRRRTPDPELFLTAVGRLGLSPGDCLVVEDAPDGVAAARAAGCRCLAVTGSVPPAELTAADRIVEGLVDIDLAFVRALIDGV